MKKIYMLLKIKKNKTNPQKVKRSGGARSVMVIVVRNGHSDSFKSRTRLIAFHIALIPLGKVGIQLFSLQLWVNSRTD